MPTPQISVIIPVYNGARYLAPAIESILQQSFANFELLLIDDGSSDGSLDIAQGYARQDARVRVAQQRNGGISRATNHGIALAQAPLIAPMDHDDVSLPTRLQLEFDAFQANPRLVCVSGHYEIIDGRGRYLTTLYQPFGDAVLQGIALTGHCPIAHSGCMMRKDAVLAVGGYRPEYDLAQDLDLFLRLGEVGELGNVPAPVLRYRVHASAQSEKRCLEQRMRAKAACEDAWRRRQMAGEFTAESLYRPDGTRGARHRFALQYGWWALGSGQWSTALDYAWQAAMARPYSSESWRLLACSVLRRR